MRIAFIGAVELSAALLDHVRGLPDAEIAGVVTRATAGPHADFCSLAGQADDIGCPSLIVDDRPNIELSTWIRERDVDVVYCFGWSRLLDSATLRAAPLGVVGYHPTLLPANRGRHPVIWALALGLEETGSTFFMMGEKADSGDIVSQVTVPIDPEDTAADLLDRLAHATKAQIADVTRGLASGSLDRRAQDEARATWWRKRTPADGEIDWRMPARGVHDLVRALHHPYPGAHFRHAGGEVKVWRTEVLADAPPNAEPGKVLRSHGGVFSVKCGMGAVRVTEHECERVPQAGSYL